MSQRGSKSLIQINQAKSIKLGTIRYKVKKKNIILDIEDSDILLLEQKGIILYSDLNEINVVELVIIARQKILELSQLLAKPSRGVKVKLGAKSKLELIKLIATIQNKILETLKIDKNENDAD